MFSEMTVVDTRWFKQPIAEVLDHAGVDVMAGARENARVAGWVDFEGRVTIERAKGETERVTTPVGLPAETLALRFKSRDVADGWIAYYVPADEVDVDAIGRLCVVQLDSRDKPRYIGVVTKGYDRGTYNVATIQPGGKTLESVRLVSASVVEWLKLG